MDINMSFQAIQFALVSAKSLDNNQLNLLKDLSSLKLDMPGFDFIVDKSSIKNRLTDITSDLEISFSDENYTKKQTIIKDFYTKLVHLIPDDVNYLWIKY